MLIELIRVTLGGKPKPTEPKPIDIPYRVIGDGGRTPYPNEDGKMPRVLDTPTPPNYPDY